MDVEAAREYYTLEETQKVNALKRKRLLTELDELDGPQKRVKTSSVNMALTVATFEKRMIDLDMMHLEHRHSASVSREFTKRGAMGLKIALVQMEAAVLDRLESSLAGFRGVEYVASDKLKGKYTLISKLEEELRQMPYARPLNVIPALTLPVAYHPPNKKLCLETGSLNADIWHHLLFSCFIRDRATLRTLRLCNVSLAILIHSLSPEITGYYFCT